MSSVDRRLVRLALPPIPILRTGTITHLRVAGAVGRLTIAVGARTPTRLVQPVTRLVIGVVPPGPPGPPGPTATIIWRETPGGALNGSNVIFTLAYLPVVQSESVILNGIELEDGAGADYTISGPTITMAVAPQAGDRLLVTYQPQ